MVDGFRIVVTPTSEREEIRKISASYRPQKSSAHQTIHLDTMETVGSITYHLTDFDNQSLITHINELMKKMCSSDLEIIENDWRQRVETDNDVKITDIFIMGVATYLGFLALLEIPEMWDEMPFQFTLPTSVMSGNTLNNNMFRYLQHPLAASRKVAPTHLLMMIDLVISFMNSWGDFFDDGPEVEIERSLLETVTGFSHSIIEKADDIRLFKIEMKNHLNESILNIHRKIEEEMIMLNNKETLWNAKLNESFKKLEEKSSIIYNRIDELFEQWSKKISQQIENELDRQRNILAKHCEARNVRMAQREERENDNEHHLSSLGP